MRRAIGITGTRTWFASGWSRARRLGCSFEEIKDIVAMQEEESMPTPYLLEHKVVEVGNEIDRLQSVQIELSRLHDVALRPARDKAAECAR